MGKRPVYVVLAPHSASRGHASHWNAGALVSGNRELRDGRVSSRCHHRRMNSRGRAEGFAPAKSEAMETPRVQAGFRPPEGAPFHTLENRGGSAGPRRIAPAGNGSARGAGWVRILK